MINKFFLHNLILGMISVDIIPNPNFEKRVNKSIYLSKMRAKQENISVLQAIKKNSKEIFYGQFFYLLLSILLIFSVFFFLSIGYNDLLSLIIFIPGQIFLFFIKIKFNNYFFPELD